MHALQNLRIKDPTQNSYWVVPQGSEGPIYQTVALEPRKWDTVEHLKTEEEMALYLEARLEEVGDDAALIAKVWVILPAPKA